ncbi:unnamed protein product [Polarella glacialis]|uniref:Uncharacterized protein n=1 Tax=Polarella glacialis TaxID=89957 RepID=A0A813G0N8_POLGL|nr:unnamed protein product [Polarella glacialis]
MSVDRAGTLAVDIAGAQYGGGRGSSSGATFSTQDESTPAFYPETVSLAFNSQNRSIGTGATALIFLGVRRYFSGQSGSHGYDPDGLSRPLFNHGNPCGDLRLAKLIPPSRLLAESVVTTVGTAAGDLRVRMYQHSLGVLTSSCGTCAGGNPPNTADKFRTAGETCLVQWEDGRSGCGASPAGGWTYWKDVWILVGALRSDLYPAPARQAFADIVQRVGTGPWGAGVWWGNTLQYFVVAWLATALLWSDQVGPQLDYYAYGAASGQQEGLPLGGFCEQYQAQGYSDVVQRLPKLDAALEARERDGFPVTVAELYAKLQACSRCQSRCSFPGVGPAPADVYCTSPCTDDFLQCLVDEDEELQVEGAATVLVT